MEYEFDSTLDRISWLLFFFPLERTLIGRFVMTCDQATTGQRIILLFMAFANGILEEILWRGTFITLFPGNVR
jgi:hypothetical protein